MRLWGKKVKNTFWIKGVNKVGRGRNSETIRSPIDLIVEDKGDDNIRYNSDSVKSGVTDNSDLSEAEKDIDNDLITTDNNDDGTNAITKTSNDMIYQDLKEESCHHVEPLNTRRNSISFLLTEGISSDPIAGSHANNSISIDDEKRRLSSISRSFSGFAADA